MMSRKLLFGLPAVFLAAAVGRSPLVVRHLMGISDCDPIRFGLLFKRSITRDRIGVGVSVTDFATMSAGRHKVIGSASMVARLWMWSRRAFLKDAAASGTSAVGGKGVVAQTRIGNEQSPAAESCGYRNRLRVRPGRDWVMERWALITRLASAFREFVVPRYRPELYYMRGPGPASARRENAR